MSISFAVSFFFCGNYSFLTMEASVKPGGAPDDWGASDSEVEGVLSPGCSSVPTTLLTSDFSAIPGSDSEMLDVLNSGSRLVSDDSCLNKKRKLCAPTDNSSAASLPLLNLKTSYPTYAGFQDPDFYSLSAHTHNPIATRDNSLQHADSPKRFVTGVEGSEECGSSRPSPLSLDGESLASVPPNTKHIILVEPVADSRPVGKFFSNDVAIARSVKDSLFTLML